jgi:hypothetical protein
MKRIGKSWRLWLRWWVMFLVLCVATYVLWSENLFTSVWKIDWTKICFIIFGIFTISTLYTGRLSFAISKYNGKVDFAWAGRRMKVLWYIADQLLSIGMIGTVIGFIAMLNSLFTTSSFNPSMIPAIISSMTSGMSVALYTTASGLICSLLLKTQLIDLEQQVDYEFSKEEGNEELF